MGITPLSSTSLSQRRMMFLADKLTCDLPRNLEIAELRFLLVEYLKQQPKRRHRDWAAQKRRQRARIRARALAALEGDHP